MSKEKEQSLTNQILNQILYEKKEAIRMFGEYTYHDKGPSEVMDIDSICMRLEIIGAKYASDVLIELNKKDSMLAGHILGALQEWDDLFDQEVANIVEF